MTTLRDPDDALVWLFMDDNQRVYDNRLEVPDEFRPFDLDPSTAATPRRSTAR